PVYDAGSDGPGPYIASAFIEGRTLSKALNEAPIDWRQGAEIVRRLAEALAYAHEQGIIHRDVKPANILLDAQNHPYLADFGLACSREAGDPQARPRMAVGTATYMAPEQALGRPGPPLPASDQYSLGAVLYRLLCGSAPFDGPAADVLHKV